MRSNLILLSALLLSLLLTGGVAAQEAEDIIIYNVWARPTAAQPAEVDDPEAGPVIDDSDLMGGMDDVDHEMGDMAANDMDDAGDMDGMSMGPVSAAYMLIENSGDQPLRLVAAETPVAGVVEIHETQIDDAGVARMRQTTGIEIPPGETVRLQPGGFHVMLMDLQRDLYPEEGIPLKLVFETPDGTTSEVLTAAVTQDLPPAENDIVIYDARLFSADVLEPADGEHEQDHQLSNVAAEIYLQINNRAVEDDMLVEVSSLVTESVDLHSAMMNDAMSDDSIMLPTGTVTQLDPDGTYIMVTNPDIVLSPDTAIVLDLTFASGSVVRLAVPVSGDFDMPDMSDMSEMDMEHDHEDAE